MDKEGHTLGFFRRGRGTGVDVEPGGAVGFAGVGLGVTSSNTAGDDGGGDERPFMLILYYVLCDNGAPVCPLLIAAHSTASYH